VSAKKLEVSEPKKKKKGFTKMGKLTTGGTSLESQSLETIADGIGESPKRRCRGESPSRRGAGASKKFKTSGKKRLSRGEKRA